VQANCVHVVLHHTQQGPHCKYTYGKNLVSLHKCVEQLHLSADHHCLCLYGCKFTPYRESALTFMTLSTILQGKQDTFREKCHPKLQRNARKHASSRHTNRRLCYGHSAVPQPKLRPNRTERLLSHVLVRPRRQAGERFVNEQALKPKCERQSARHRLLCTALPSATAPCSKDSTRSSLSIQSTAKYCV